MDYWTLRTSWESFNIIAKLNLCFKGLLPKLHGLTHYFYDCQYECPFITVTRIMSAWWLCPISDPTNVCLIMQEMRKTLFGETTNENKQISKIMILDQPKLLRAPLQIHLWMNYLISLLHRINVLMFTLICLHQFLSFHFETYIVFRGFGFVTFATCEGVDRILAHGTHTLDGKKVGRLC